MSNWALILGASTGHGGATAVSLAKKDYGILGFHFDRGEAKKIAEETIKEVNELSNGRCHYFNTNAASEEAIETYLPQIKEITDPSRRMFSNFTKFFFSLNLWLVNSFD